MDKRTRLAWIIFLQFISVSAVAAVNSVASLADPLDNSGASARALGMGSAFVGVADDSSALFWNPSGLGTLNSDEFAIHHNSWLAGIIQETAVLAVPMAELGTFAADVNYINYGSLDGYDDTGTKIANYSPNRYGLGLGWGKELIKGVSVGAALKGSTQTIGDTNYATLGLDLGALWVPIRELRLGLDVTNLGSSVAGYAQASDIRLGASYHLSANEDNQLLLALGSSIEPGGVDRLQMGVEDRIHRFLALRIGYQAALADTQIDGLTGLTGGLGVYYEAFSLDYAYLPYGDLGTTQRISLAYRFGPQRSL